MRLEKITLRNFRQFYGDQELQLATDEKKNVTLIHAENGVGKTTILNAVLWALYGDVTSKFEQRERIVNFEALSERKTSATVSVQFEFDSKTYVVQRHHIHSNDEEKVAVFRVEGGVSKDMPAAETFINSVIPREMARYFFFDGEAAESFSSEVNDKEISRAIRSMLGCDLAETAIEDLKALGKVIDDQIGNLPGEEELKELEDRLNEAESDIQRERDAKEKTERDIATFSAQLDEIVKRLRETEGARQFQIRREEKVQALKEVEQDIKGEQDEIVRWVGQKAVQVVSRKLAKETLEFIDEASLKGKIPSPYNEEFVKGLLKAESCICHRPLVPGSPEWKGVADLLKSASNAITMGRVVQARARIQQLKEGALEAPRLLEAANAKLGALANRRNVLEQEIAELGRTIEQLPILEIAEREAARKKLDATIRLKSQDMGAIKHRLQQAELRKIEVEREIARVGAKNDKSRRLLRRRSLVTGAARHLKAVLDEYERDARSVIQKQMNDVLEKVARRDYRCRFNEDFSLELLWSDGKAAPKSGGENQLLSLTFIASLIKFSEIRSKASGDILRPGTIAPLVLDSPFGQLDVKYREDTADFIPKMASQVILLVSSSQGDEHVLKALAPHVGAEYVLISENRGARGGKTEDRMVLHGKEYVCSLFSRPKNMTRIEPVV